MKEIISVFLKGAAMGAANVIPGVSGGTVAFITGIYERLIFAIKALSGKGLKLLLKGKVKEFVAETDLLFLIWLGLGVVGSILTLAALLEYLFDHYEKLVWAFFFGLILASIYFVGKRVSRWSFSCIGLLLAGAAVAVAVSLMKPASENASIPYLVLCGIVAMASMIIPGLSGSFVLLLMGNYRLVMIESVSHLKSLESEAFAVLIPVGIGAVIGLVTLSRILAWVFKQFHDQAVALLTGFVAGSLMIIWPWKEAIVETFELNEKVKEKVVGYHWQMPDLSGHTAIAALLILVGVVLVWVMEKSGETREKGKES